MQSQVNSKAEIFPIICHIFWVSLSGHFDILLCMCCAFLRMKERVYSTISLGIKRGKGNKIENHKKILSKWRNLVSNSSGNWRRGKPWSLIFGRQPHLSLQFLETIRVVKRDTNVRKKLSLFHCQDSIELGKNAYLPEVSFRTWATMFLNKGVWFERFQKPYLFT